PAMREPPPSRTATRTGMSKSCTPTRTPRTCTTATNTDVLDFKPTGSARQLGSAGEKTESSRAPKSPALPVKALRPARGLQVHPLHGGGRVPRARGDALRGHLVDATQVVLGQLHPHRSRVLLQVLALLGAWDGHDVLSLREQPRERELRRSAALLRRDLAHPLHELQVPLEILTLEPRMVAPVVVRRQVLVPLEAPGEEPAAERAVGDEPDPQLPHGGQDLLLHVPAPERVLRL